MKCKLKRFNNEMYCTSDFQYTIDLCQINVFDQDQAYISKDTKKKITVLHTIRCHVKKNRIDFEVAGELADSLSSISCIFIALDRITTDLIKANIKDYIVIFDNRQYKIDEFDYIDNNPRSRFTYINATRINT